MNKEIRLQSIDDSINNIKTYAQRIKEKSEKPDISDEELKRVSTLLIGVCQILHSEDTSNY